MMKTSLLPEYANLSFQKGENIYDVPRPIASGYDSPRKVSDSVIYQNDFAGSIYQNSASLLNGTSVLENPEALYQKLNLLSSSDEVIETQQAQLKELTRYGEHAQTMRNREGRTPKSSATATPQTFVKDPKVEVPGLEEMMLLVAEFNYQKNDSKENLQKLSSALKNCIFVLEGIVENSTKVFYGEYGDVLGAKLTQHLAKAKRDLDLAKTRLNAALEIQKRWRPTEVKTPDAIPQSIATEIPTPIVNRGDFFRRHRAISDSETLLKNPEVMGNLKSFTH